VAAILALSSPGCDCGEEEVTEILAQIDSDLTVPDELDSLQVRIESSRGGGPAEERLDVTYQVVASVPGDTGGSVGGTNVRLPVRIGIVPGSRADTVIRVEAVGRPGTDAGEVRVSASLAFSRGRALLLPLHLARVCGGVACGAGETCQDQDGAPRCVPETIFNPPCALADLDTGRIEACIPDTGEDAGSPCSTLVCPPGTECQAGACVSTDPCLGIICDEGLVCSFGECVDARLDEDGDGYPVSSDCDDHDPDVIPGTVAPCSSECGEGTSTCGNGGWLPCTAPSDCSCTAGETRSEACGRCGSAERACTSEGVWGALGACEGEGDCVPGSSQSERCEGGSACSQHTRVCADTCAWHDWGACEDPGQCVPGATEDRACGNCGSETRACSDQCLWGTFGACEGEGACAPNATEQQACGNCGTQTRSCDAACQWSAWGLCGQGACSPGAAETRSCGSCGLQTRSCADDCNWALWSGCAGEGACAPGATESRACGNCGTQSRVCAADCSWGAWGGCGGEGVCAPGGSGSCGNCGSRTCTAACTWGTCSGEGVCAAGATRGCGNCGGGTETCTAACTWGGVCANEPCTPLSTETEQGPCCANTTRQRVCSLQCVWETWSDCCDFDAVCDLPCENWQTSGCSDCACDNDFVCEFDTNGENCGPCLHDCNCPDQCGLRCGDPGCCSSCDVGVCTGSGCGGGADPCN